MPGAGHGDGPGPPKATGKGLFSNGLIAMLFTERYVAGRSMNSLVTGLARQARSGRARADPPYMRGASVVGHAGRCHTGLGIPGGYWSARDGDRLLQIWDRGVVVMPDSVLVLYCAGWGVSLDA